jgi:hypothetical protein
MNTQSNQLSMLPEAPENAPTDLIAMAINKGADIETIERLLALKERVDAKKAEEAFNAALNRCQSAMGRVAANKENQQTRSRYADYAALDRVLRPIYTHEGFSLSFDTGPSPEAAVLVLCHVSHAGGHTRTYRAEMPADGKGAKGNDVMTRTHAVGSGMSYGMRYLLKMIFNVAIGETDDDGNAAGAPYDITDWADAITDAADLVELQKIAADLRAQTKIPPAALRNIRALWSTRAKELK